MGIFYIFGLFLVVIVAIILQLVFRSPLAVAAFVAVGSLIAYAFFSATLTTIFIVWIVIYTLVALLTAYLTSKFTKCHNNCNRCDRNDF